MGQLAVTENGEEILKEQTFTVPVWDEKENFYIRGMRNYSGTEFDFRSYELLSYI